jgi:hypothetical protein
VARSLSGSASAITVALEWAVVGLAMDDLQSEGRAPPAHEIIRHVYQFLVGYEGECAGELILPEFSSVGWGVHYSSLFELRMN